jgi:hypothetical protein
MRCGEGGGSGPEELTESRAAREPIGLDGAGHRSGHRFLLSVVVDRPKEFPWGMVR